MDIKVHLASRLMVFYDKIILNFHEIAPVFISNGTAVLNCLESSNICSRGMMINPLMLIFSERKSGVRNDLFLGEFIPRIQFLHNNSRIDSKNDL